MLKKKHWGVLVLVLAAWFLAKSEAIYSDQIGVADWHRVGLGSVTTAVFSNRSQTVLVGTKQGVVAALDATTGEINWRRRVSPAAAGSSTRDEILSVESSSSGEQLVVVLSGPAQVRVSLWKQKTGELLWDSTAWNVSSGGGGGGGGGRGRVDVRGEEEDVVEARMVSDQNNDQWPDLLAAFRRFGVILRSGRTGQVMWRRDVQAETGVEEAAVLRVVVLMQSQLVVVCQTAPHTVHLLRIDLATGRMLGSQVIGDVLPSQAVYLVHHVVLLDATALQLVAVAYHHSAQPTRVDIRTLDSFTNVADASIFVQTVIRDERRVSGAGRSFVLRLPHERLDLVCAVDSQSAATVLSFHPQDSEQEAASYALSQDGQVLVTGRQVLADRAATAACSLSDAVTPRAVQLRGVVPSQRTAPRLGSVAQRASDLDDDEELVIELQVPRQPGIRALYLSPATKQGIHVLIVRHDDSVLLFRTSSGSSTTLLWSREEYLASVTKAVFIDLPRVTAGLTADVFEHLEQGLLSRLSWHVQQLSTLSAASASVSNIFQHHRQQKQKQQQQQQDQPQGLLSDTFGFRKLLVLLTNAGRVVAFDTQSGHLVWSIYYPCALLDDLSIIFEETAATTIPRALVLLRSTAEQQQHTAAGEGEHFASILDVLTVGQPYELERRALGVRASRAKALTGQRRPLPLLAGPSSAFTLLVDETLHTCYLLSHTAARGTELRALQDDAGDAAGLVHVTVGPTSLQGHTCAGRAVWQRRFTSTDEAETVIGTALFPDDHAVSSPVKVFGNSSIATKYINPNKIVVATRSHYSTASNKRESILNVYVIDTIVGLELLHYSHRHGDGPVLLYQADNWVGYQYWHTQASRFEFVSIDFYYPASAATSTEGVFSSHDRIVPVAHSAAFVAPDPLTAMTTSKSLLGITPRHLLWVASSSRVLALDGRFVDPRRPVGAPSDEDRVEELLPYYPELTSPIRGHLSYNLSLLGLDQIEAHPTDVESTTLVFAFGLDLFFTRYAPAQQFDLLQEEFNKPLLLLTVAIVLLLSAITTLLNRRKLRNFFWD